MRLAVFTNQFPGRASTFIARDMRGLLEAGVEIDIFAIYPLEPELWHYVPSILSKDILARDRVHHISLAQSLISLRPFPIGKFGSFLRDAVSITTSAGRLGVEPLSKSAYVLLKGWAWFQRHANKYDHILAYWGNHAATCAYVYHRLTAQQIPFTIFLHAGLDLYWNPPYMRKKLLYSDNIVTCSEFNLQFMRDHFPDIFHLIENKIYVHHHGLDFNEFPYEPGNRPVRKVIAVGRLEMYKGFDYLLHATYDLKCRGIDIEVELVGDGKEAGDLRALANELLITDRIRFRGWLTSDEVRKAMEQASILVHPSLDLGDGVPNVVKEAMALGTPVVASSVAGIPEILDNGRCGRLVPPKDVKALSLAVETLLADDVLRRKYADAARIYVEEKCDLWRNGHHLAELLCASVRISHTGSHQGTEGRRKSGE